MTEQSQLTDEQIEMNKRVTEQLQRVPVLQKHIQILEHQGMQQRNELAELAVQVEQAQQVAQRLQHELDQERANNQQEQDENSES